jgi:ribosomal protein S18 acetylase RimI-like enzyme
MSDETANIRACTLEDIAAVLELWRQAASPGPTDTAEDLRRALDSSAAHVLVAEVGSRVIGSVIGSFDGWRGNLYRLVVHPELRRRGIARALVAELERALAREGARRISALVETDRPWAMSFWEAAGYRVDERVVRFIRDP